METKERAYQLIQVGYQKNASDLYIFPGRKGYELSYRFHQNKWHYGKLSESEAENLILFFKYTAEMDVSERRKTQVGSATFEVNQKLKRLRLSTVADYRNRESLVIRFLHDFDRKAALHYFFQSQLREIESEISGRGLFLFSGPTGSGKSTTMYHLGKQLESEQKQVITIEDPVEIEESNFLQLQTNEKIQLNYEQLVKVCLRHRPDILIVGEIRDRETAQMVMRGALTGHTIFSTLHTRNKEGVIPRLMELGITKVEINQCLRGIIYQRLLPQVCHYCLGKCSVYCTQYQTNGSHGVLFDTIFSGGEEDSWERKSKSWGESLRKAWACGFISKEVYLAERFN